MIDISKITINTMSLSDLEEIKDTLQTDFDDFWNFEIFKEELTNRLGREPNVSMIAEILNISEFEVNNALDSMKETVSMFEPIYNDGGDTIYLFDQISNKKDEYDLDYKLAVVNAMKQLKNRERQILEERFLVGKTQMEIASELGISQAQISRIEKNAIKTLKKNIK